MGYKFSPHYFENEMTFGFYQKNTSSTCAFMAIIIIILIGVIIVMFMNIRKRKFEAESLIQNQEQFKKIINAVPDIICFKDGCGKYVIMNKACVDILELSSETYIGKTNVDLLKVVPRHEKVLKNFAESDKRVWCEGRVRKEETIIMNNGEKKIFDVIKIPIFNEDGSKRGVGVFGRDITDNKVNEKLKKKAYESKKMLEKFKQDDKVKTEFFANVSHELRTPLNVMLSSVQLIQLYMSKEKIIDNSNQLDKNMGILTQNALRLLRLINNLIDITKIDGGFYTVNLKNYDIVNLIEETTLSVAEYIESNDVKLIFDTNVEEKILACDAEKVERIMLNLLSNAAKFTPKNGCINVNLFDKGDRILISVKDTGVGIPKEKQKEIFKRFRQVNDKSINNCQGSGIGLSLVKSMVELHDGNIKVESEETKGSEFIIELPVKILSNESVNINNTIDMNTKSVNLEFSDFARGIN